MSYCMYIFILSTGTRHSVNIFMCTVHYLLVAMNMWSLVRNDDILVFCVMNVEVIEIVLCRELNYMIHLVSLVRK